MQSFYNEEATFNCDNGYAYATDISIDTITIKCQTDGTWETPNDCVKSALRVFYALYHSSTICSVPH